MYCQKSHGESVAKLWRSYRFHLVHFSNTILHIISTTVLFLISVWIIKYSPLESLIFKTRTPY